MNFVDAVREAVKGKIIQCRADSPPFDYRVWSNIEWRMENHRLVAVDDGRDFVCCDDWVIADWEVVPEPHDFTWAFARMKEGKKVRRRKWALIEDKTAYIFEDSDDKSLYNISMSSIFATDWELCTDEH